MGNNNNNDLKDEKKDDLRDEKKKENEEEKDTEYNELEERKSELKERLKYGMRKKKKKKANNENGGKDPQKNPKKKFSFKTVIMLLFVVTIIMSLPSMMNNAKTKDQKVISYTEFLKKANNGEFKVVQEKEGYVIGKKQLEDTIAFRARMISNRVSQDPNLMKAFTQTSVEIKSEDPAKTPLIVQILISWFPMLLLVGIWIFMMNKMKGGGNSGPSVFNMG